MRFFKKYIFPVIYGLIVYFTIRLLQDTGNGSEFWKRSWILNLFEIAVSLAFSFLAIYLYHRLFNYFDNKYKNELSGRRITNELITFLVLNIILANVILIPFAASTDDGLSLSDFVTINTIPTLYSIIYYGISRSNTYFTAYLDHKLLLEKLSNDHLQTELKFLKAQYHPHFLFNALNTIYFQMDENIQGAKISIEKLSELLRYQLYDQQQMVTVAQEVQYLYNFIDLQKVRSSKELNVDVNICEGLGTQLIFPLLLLPLVENAFKYVGGEYNINIKAFVEDHNLVFTVINSIATFEPVHSKSGGIGLENLKRRLDLLYPDQHNFDILKNGHTFTARLSLALRYEK